MGAKNTKICESYHGTSLNLGQLQRAPILHKNKSTMQLDWLQCRNPSLGHTVKYFLRGHLGDENLLKFISNTAKSEWIFFASF